MRALSLLGVLTAVVLPPAAANATVGFRDLMAAGQGSSVNAAALAVYELTGAPPPSFTAEEPMFERLLYDQPQLTAADVLADFKDSSVGGRSGGAVESPRPGVMIARDAFDVPHITGLTRADAMWGAGYAQAEDRLFVMDVLRHLGAGDLSEFIGAGGGANLALDRAVFLQTDWVGDEARTEIESLPQRFGAAGAQALADYRAYDAGINAYIDATRANALLLPAEYAAIARLPAPWQLQDSVYALAEISEGFDLGGGFEAQNGELLDLLRARLGRMGGLPSFADLSEIEDPEAPATVSSRFEFDRPGRLDPRSLALPDEATLQMRDPVIGYRPPPGAPGSAAPSAAFTLAARSTWIGRLARSRLGRPGGESFAFLVGRDRSRSGHPIADMGPQVDFYSPEIFLEEELRAPGLDVRGVTVPGFGPLPVIGHTDRYAWSATIGVGDHIDTFAERLCNPDGGRPSRSSTHYVYRGRCVPLEIVDRTEHLTPNANDLEGSQTITMRTVRSVHGPIQATATVGGDPVAYARADSTYHHLADNVIGLESVAGGVSGPQAFIRALAPMPFSLNWFYIDSRHIAWVLSGTYPHRARGVSAQFPSWGTGRWDWRGFDPGAYDEHDIVPSSHPHAIDPPSGFLANWNNKPAPGWRAADDDFYYGPAHRVQMVSRRLERLLAGRRRIDPVQLVSLVEDADTADMRGEEDLPWLLRAIGPVRDRATATLVGLLSSWMRAGAHRRDLAHTGYYADGAAVALMDAWWPRAVAAIFEPVMGTNAYTYATQMDSVDNGIDDPPNTDAEAWYDGWYGQVSKDLRDLLVPRRVRGRYSRIYCGGGSRRSCRARLLASLRAAAAAVASSQGTSAPSRWREPVTCPIPAQGFPPCDEIVFTPLGAVQTPPIPWQNRPTYQQVVEVGR
jgi:acyl-homoserine lactone acylase PvdQ